MTVCVSVCAPTAGMLFGAPKASLFMGLWGYNSVLACIATGGMFFVARPRTLLLATSCAFLCALMQGAMTALCAPFGVTPLTMPFCTGTIVYVALQRSLPHFIPVPLASLTTPEEHVVRARQAEEEAAAAVAHWAKLSQCGRRALERLRRIRAGMITLCPPQAVAAGRGIGVPADVLLTAVRRYMREFPVAQAGGDASDGQALVRGMARVNGEGASVPGGWVPFPNVFVPDESNGGGPNVVMLALEHAALVAEARALTDAVGGVKRLTVGVRRKPVRSVKVSSHVPKKGRK